MSGWRETYSGVVHSWMCDHFGHVNVRYYAHIFDDAGFVLWSVSDLSLEDLRKHGVHTVVARTETDLKKELVAGNTIRVRSRWVRLGAKSLTYEQELLSIDTGELHASQRVVEVCFDPETRSSSSIPQPIRDILVPQLAPSSDKRVDADD